ncbi:hypothetical protein GJU40_01870 [Bacillus lacus]|uniref:Uncharacterized protein n=1 Tax=Metabacillus lacus TaxID=1983721 RepID=A0A7X2IWI3_9BACI|nr:hypothetical protein [Metabacillus lacus]MRX70915.1 hypothetical protein [Metabacillus lacus]
MFDPTVFDNLKVLLEGHIYDLDLQEEICVTGRKDLVDLASMSRSCTLEFIPVNSGRYLKAFITLEISHEQISGELLGTGVNPGCSLTMKFETLSNEQSAGEKELSYLKDIWGSSVSYDLEVKWRQSLPGEYLHVYELKLKRMLTEEEAQDLYQLVQHAELSFSAFGT